MDLFHPNLNISYPDEVENDNRRSIVADGRSEISNASGNSRRPTIDSNMSRDRPYLSRDLNLLVAPTGGICFIVKLDIII